MTRIVGAILVALAVSASVATAQDANRPATAKATASAPLNLNTATADQLESLPGIGARTAALIVEYRQKNGGFKKVEEILENRSSGPDLLRFLHVGARRSVSRSRQKPQEISR
jgi:competence protein ComEA